MSSVYINDFDQPTYQYKYLGPINLGHVNYREAAHWVRACIFSIPFLVYRQTADLRSFERFGSMLPGTTPPSNAPAVDIVVEEKPARLCIGPMLGSQNVGFTGAAVTVDASAASVIWTSSPRSARPLQPRHPSRR